MWNKKQEPELSEEELRVIVENLTSKYDLVLSIINSYYNSGKCDWHGYAMATIDSIYKVLTQDVGIK